ncbi:hypothetical protein GCM10009540_92830 [Streptomyces turgidiscabies]
MNELYDEKVWQDAYQIAEERGLDDIDAVTGRDAWTVSATVVP